MCGAVAHGETPSSLPTWRDLDVATRSSQISLERAIASHPVRSHRAPLAEAGRFVDHVAMRAFLVAIALVGCSDDAPKNIDAAIPIDAVPDAPPDAPVPACTSYCAEIQANCTGANAQYADVAHCLTACNSFTVGTSTDMLGNTLGCRLYHADAAGMGTPELHCQHAGPGGDQISAMPQGMCSGGDVCESFCKLQIQACGSLEAPLPGDPLDETNNHLFQYRNLERCIGVCARFDKNHLYSTLAAGDSLACRLYQATAAAVAVMPDGVMHCAFTGETAKGPCAGPPTP